MVQRGKTAQAAIMFFGEYEHAIDEKSRLTLPARFREAFGGGVVIAKGIDANLDVYPRESWTAVVEERLAGLDPFSRETRELQRFFFSGVVDAVPDKQGRVLVPPKLAERAGMTRAVVVVGVYDHLEIWDRDAWAEHLHAVEGRVDDVAERLAEKRS